MKISIDCVELYRLLTERLGYAAMDPNEIHIDIPLSGRDEIVKVQFADKCGSFLMTATVEKK